MTPKEKETLNELFQKLEQMEMDSAPRSGEAESLFQGYLHQQPAAPYYMAQLLLLQKDGLANAKSKIDALEAQLAELSDRQAQAALPIAPPELSTVLPPEAPVPTTPVPTTPITYNRRSFLEGATQAALGIGGGLLLADFVTGLFGGEMAEDARSEADFYDSDELSEPNNPSSISEFDLDDGMETEHVSDADHSFGLSDFDLFSYDVDCFL